MFVIWSSDHGIGSSFKHIFTCNQKNGSLWKKKKIYSYSGSGLSYFSLWEQGKWGDGRAWDLSIFIKALLLVESLLNTELTLTGNWVLDKEHKQDIFLYFLEDNDSSLPLRGIVPELSFGREKKNAWISCSGQSWSERLNVWGPKKTWYPWTTESCCAFGWTVTHSKGNHCAQLSAIWVLFYWLFLSELRLGPQRRWSMYNIPILSFFLLPSR